MINITKFYMLQRKFLDEVPFFTKSKMKKLKEGNKKYYVYIFGTAILNTDYYSYAFNTIDSGIVILKYRNEKKLVILDFGLELKHRNKHYGETIVKIIHETFPNCEIIINDYSDAGGFWRAMWKKYPRITLS